MDLNLLFLYIRQPIVLYTVVLTVIWLLLLVINEYSKKLYELHFLKKLFSVYTLFAISLTYMLLTLLLIYINEISLFPILHAIILGITLLTVLSLKLKGLINVISTYLVFVVALMPLIVMLTSRHPYPLGDDARFPGFAIVINENGRWIPNVYAENPYYQFFHLIPFMEYVVAVITGVSLDNVMGYYLPFKIFLHVVYGISVYLIMKELTKNSVASLIAVLLLFITPPLSFVQVTHQRYAIILFLMASLLLLKTLTNKSSINPTLAIFPLVISGIIAHATFTLMFTAFTLPLILVSRDLIFKRNIAKLLLFSTIIVSLIYWIGVRVLDTIVGLEINAIEKFIDLLSRCAIPWQGTRMPWYTERMQVFFIAWALIPSIVCASLLFFLFQYTLKRRRSRGSFLVMLLGFLGLTGTGLNYILRALSTFGGRYFYWLYHLMLPLSTLTIVKTSKRSISLVAVILLISMISFYGIQDPTISANTYGDYIGWADRTSWEIAKGLIPYIRSEAKMWLDPRIGAPVSALTPPPPLGGDFSTGQVVAIISEDSIGLRAMSKDPRNVYFFKRYFNNDPSLIFNNLNNFNIIFRCGSYYGIAKP